MSTDKLRFAVLMDIAFSVFQEEPFIGVKRYLDETDAEAVFFGIGGLDFSNPEDRMRMQFLDMISPEEFDGIILMTATLLHCGGDQLLRDKIAARCSNLPVVSIGPSIMGEDTLIYDNANGMKLLMGHLIAEHGYRDFAHVSGPLSGAESQIRLAAFSESLKEAGIAFDESLVVEGNFLPPSGYEAVSEFFDKRGLSPRVIVCANDFMALGVWNALIDRGINVPFDVAVTGYDDSQLSQALSHQFTTVRQSFNTLGYLAAKRLHAIIKKEPVEPVVPLVSELRIRSSCGCVEFERRVDKQKTGPVVTGYEDIKSKVLSCIKQQDPDCDPEDIYRSWSDIVHGTLRGKRPVYELEDMLRDSSNMLVDSGFDLKNNQLFITLYSLLLEECNQSVFVDFWKENFFSMNLRVAMDNLHAGLMKDPSVSACNDLMKSIAELCGADTFLTVYFDDHGNYQAGAKVAYSKGAYFEHMSPEPGAWFPSKGCGSLVANIISYNDECYGYILIDASVEPVNTYDYLRIRFSGISKDIDSLKNIITLNQELMHEIAEREAVQKKLEAALTLVERLSVEDDLTRLRNRRGFLTSAEQQVKFLRRQDNTFYILYADLDKLKPINDTYGHQEGDLAIRSAADVLRSALRESDIIGRMGGDEFTVLVNKAKPSTYQMIRQRIENICDKKNIELNKPWKLSMSIGRFFSDQDCNLPLEEMIELADEDLYKEKQRKKKG
ncbi:MAG: GGDEF domain-containing protein [Spirochaetes bacterium]|jgi:diguanylate cyclase (GGDEF)-like protein|nr:GGDEF domain-containing protein [Spirochaetota bacterium]